MSKFFLSDISYRPEIDGLRALAVVPVVFFHSGMAIFSGGFVGVDIFFVISGYLITSILIKSFSSDSFSFCNFYYRRARRILPVLLFVVLFCFLFSWLLMPPEGLKNYGLSVLSVLSFVSNMYFWKVTNYFSPAAELQPLLHTWSLSVEEQFYIIFPFFMFLLWRFGKIRTSIFIFLILVLSFSLSEIGWRFTDTLHFYILPTRAWEILSGSLLAFAPRVDFPKYGKIGLSVAQLGSISGISLIVFSIFFFDKSFPFPSFFTVVPVIGTLLVIYFTSVRTVVYQVLSNKSMVYMGLMSYSVYLWHQPIFAYGRILYLNEWCQRRLNFDPL